MDVTKERLCYFVFYLGNILAKKIFDHPEEILKNERINPKEVRIYSGDSWNLMRQFENIDKISAIESRVVLLKICRLMHTEQSSVHEFQSHLIFILAKGSPFSTQGTSLQ